MDNLRYTGVVATPDLPRVSGKSSKERIVTMTEVLFLLVLMYGVFVQALVGFGGTLLSMPLGIMLMGLDLTKPVMTIVAWITGVVVLATEWRYINWRELFKMTAVMLVGVLGGIWATGRLQLNFLLIVYAVVVMGVGIKKLFFPTGREPSAVIKNGALAIAGLMQGLFVSGGSFLAVYAVAQLKEKREFRATVNAVWGILNSIMIATYYFGGSLTPAVVRMSALAVIPTLVAIWLGGVLTRKVRQATFLKVIYVVLIVSGAVLLITNL